MPITAEQITKLKVDHPEWELHSLGNSHASVVVRIPTLPEYERFLTESRDPATRTAAQRVLVTQCVVWPPPEEFAQLIFRRPALVQSFGDDIIDLAGGEKVTERKKL